MGIREKLRASLGRDPTHEEIQIAKQRRDVAKQQGISKPLILPGAGSDDGDKEDWTCASCSALCYASKLTCFKCGAARGGTTPDSKKKHRRREGAYKPPADAGECQDKTLVCKSCAAEFVYTAGEQEYFRKKGFIGVERARCSDCSKAKRKKLEADEAARKPTCGGRLICFAWQKGSCSRGDDCKFAHGEADGVLAAPVSAPAKAGGGTGGDGDGTSPDKSETTAVLKCFHCHAEGHRVADCPKAKAQREAAAPPKKKKKRQRNGTLPTANKPDAAP